MGYMRAHAIVVDSWDEGMIIKAHKQACIIFPYASPISPAASNGHRSFFIPPDGSKEGWHDSDVGDERRSKFRRWLRKQCHEDGSTSLRWVEVQFADDNDETIVTDSDAVRIRE